MAISWDTKISNVNIANKRANVTAIRTDSLVPTNEFTVSYQNTPIAGSTPEETTAARLLILDTIWEAWQQEVVKRSNIATLISDLEQAANNNLIAREA